MAIRELNCLALSTKLPWTTEIIFNCNNRKYWGGVGFYVADIEDDTHPCGNRPYPAPIRTHQKLQRYSPNWLVEYKTHKHDFQVFTK